MGSGLPLYVRFAIPNLRTFNKIAMNHHFTFSFTHSRSVIQSKFRVAFTALGLLGMAALGFAQGSESFDNAALTSSYLDGSFTGDEGFTWTYGHSRNVDVYPITGNGIMLRRASDGFLEATIPGGVGTFSFEYRKAFTGNSPRQLELIVNGTPVATSPVFGNASGADATVYTLTHNVNVSGNVTVRIKNVGTTNTNRQTVIDNISWTGVGAAPDPEPTNHATVFECTTGTPASSSIDLTWTDAVGAQLPSAYLIRWSTIGYSDIATPADGTPVSNGGDALNVNFGTESAQITGLNSETTYFFKIFPYTNAGADIDYKTDGSIPETNCTTGEAPWEDFETGSKGSYAIATVTCTAGDWVFDDALMGTSASDRKNGAQSARVRNGILSMDFDKPDGLGELTILHGVFGGDGNSTWQLEVSNNGGTSWDAFVSAPVTSSSTTLSSVTFTVNVPGNVRFRIVKTAGGTNRFNIDDISVTDFVPAVDITVDNVSVSAVTYTACDSNPSATVTYTAVGSYGVGNVFTAELSDASGNFTEPIAIGSGMSPMTIAFPENLPSGNNYRIRVVSSDPVFNSPASNAIEVIQNGSFCPQPGDFQTRNSGTWQTASNDVWQTYTYNAAIQAYEWVDVTGNPNGDDVNAYIRNGHSVGFTVSLVTVNNLIIDAGGQLLRGASDCSLRYLNLAGDIICNGTIGNGSTPDALGFNVLTGDHTITGTGSVDLYRIRLSNDGSTPQLGSANLTIDTDITLHWDPSLCSGGTNAIYNNRAETAAFNVLVNSGATLTIAADSASFGLDGAGTGTYPGTTRTGGYTVFGEIAAAGFYLAGSNNGVAGERVHLTIENGGVVRVGYIDLGVNNEAEGGAVNMAAGSLLEIQSVASGDSTWFNASSGSLVHAVDPLATVEYSRSGDQRIPSVIDYGHLVFTGSGERLLIDPVTVAQGDVTFGAGLTVSGADIDYVLEVGGDWTNNGGSFDAREGTVVFNGAGTQTIGGSAGTTFENLTMDGAGIDLAVNTNVHGVLAPESGAFDAQGFDLRLTSDADGTGSIGEIKSGASYSGNTVIERFIPSGVQFWVNLCSPIAGLTINDWNDDLITTGFTGSDFPSYAFNNVLQYDETVPLGLNDGFYGVDDVNDALDAVRGYFVYMQSGSQHVTVEGTIQQGSLTTPLEYTSTGVPENDGWELVANRYPSEIDFEALYNASSGIADHYYIYDADAGAYTLYSVGFGPTGNATGYIPSSQSFWVQTIASNAELNFEEDMKSATGVGFERSYAAVPRITMELSGLGYSHLTNVSFDASTTAGFDQGRDAVWFPSSQPAVPQLATRATGGQKLSLNRLAVPNEPVSVPIYVRTNTPGTYTFTVAAMAHLPEGLCLSIEDLSTGSVSAVAEGDSYDFEVPEPFEGDRFVLHLSVPMEVSTTAAACQGDASGSIEVQLWGSTGEVVVEDMTGAVLGSSPAGGWVSHTFDGLSSGGYVVRYISSDLVCESVSVDVYVEEPHEISTPAMTSTAAECTEATASLAIAGFTGGFNAMLYRDGELIGSYEANEALMLTGLEGALYEVVAYDACIESVSTVDLRDPNALNETLLIEPVYALTEGAAQIVAEVLTDVLATVTWYLDGEFIGTGQQLSHVVTEEGVYAYTVEIEGMHCSRTLTGTFEVQTASGVAGIASERVVLMTTSGAWMLSGLSSEAGVELDLYSADGRLVRSEQQQGNTVLRIDNENLARGIYTMVLRNADGTPVLTLKAMR